MRAVITVDKIDKREPSYMHFKCKAQKAWNVTKEEIIGELVEGERYYIDYAEGKVAPGRKYPSKYINRARNWKPEDGPDTWDAKEPYDNSSPSASGTSFQGAHMSKKDTYDPEIGKRQTAANCAMTWCKDNCKTLDELATVFPTVADVVFKYVDDKGSLAAVVDIPSKADPDGDGDSIPF